MPPRVVQGVEFAEARVEELAEGMTPAEVEDLLGRPLTVATDNEFLRWRYYYRARQDDVVRLLGVLPIRKLPLQIWEKEVVVVFAAGRVVSFERMLRDVLKGEMQASDE